MRSSKVLPLIFLICAASSIASAEGGSKGGIHPWDPKWSEAFFKCWDKYAKPNTPGKGAIEERLSKGLPDVGPGKRWCPTEGALDEPYQKALFMLAAFKNICKPESGCDPKYSDPNGVNETAIGLMQIGVNDAKKKHHCKTLSGEAITTAEQLKDASNNICCAIQIASHTAGGFDAKGPQKYKAGREHFAQGNKGFMAAFWQTTRGDDPSGNKTKDDAVSKPVVAGVNEACEQISRGGYSGGNQLTPEEFQLAQKASPEGGAKNQDGTK